MKLTLRVDEERLLTSNGVSSNNGVHVDDGLAALDASLLHAGVDLLDARVGGLETVKELLEGRREAVVGLSGIGEESIASDLRGIENIQESSARGLLLVCDIRVPSNRTDSLLEESLMRLVTSPAVDEMDLGVSGRGSRRRVDVMSAKVSAKLESLVNG